MRREFRSMKSIALIVLAVFSIGLVAFASAGQTLNVDAMAVYAQGRAVIQETRTVTLQPGFNEVDLAIPDGLIVPSLLLQSDADIQWTRFHPARRFDLLTEAVGLTVEVIDRTGAMYRGEIVAQSDGILLRQEGGAMILVADPVTLRLPDGAAVALNEDAELIVGVSSVAGGEVSIDMLYIVAGISWEASYAVFVSEEPDLGSLQTRIAVTNGAGGVFATPDLHLPGMWRVGRSLGGGNIGHAFGVDGTDEQSLTASLILSRKLLNEYERYYRQYLDGYEDMELVVTASMMGIRETRRIVGDAVLTLEHFLARAAFADEIGRYSYPVDIHAAKPDLESYNTFHKEHTELRYKKGESYGIPYGCLIPQTLDNVLTAGRCVSTDRYMQSSVRVMPGCYITGQAAGIAAALTGSDGAIRAVDIRLLQERLLNQS